MLTNRTDMCRKAKGQRSKVKVTAAAGGLGWWTCPRHVCQRSFLRLIQIRRVFTILAQIVRRHWSLAEWRHRKSTCYDYDYELTQQKGGVKLYWLQTGRLLTRQKCRQIASTHAPVLWEKGDPSHAHPPNWLHLLTTARFRPGDAPRVGTIQSSQTRLSKTVNG